MDWLLPPRCVGCRANGSWWCTECASHAAICSHAVSTGTGPLSGIEAGAYFRTPLSDAMKALKYRHVRAVGAELVRYLEPPLARILGSRADRSDFLLVPIPLHRRRQRQRGHNQAEVLARLLAERAGLPWRNALRRERATKTQTELRRAERFANVAGAFTWTGAPPDHRNVILIDDVVTTGATLAAAAETCRQTEARSVWGLAVAYRD